MTFDEEFDVVVAGYGFAGATSAIEACDAGARVLLVEKMPDPGGISICAGGGIRIAADADEAFAYLKATNADKTPDDILRVFADAMVKLPEYIGRLVKVNDAKMIGVGTPREGNYPFPGYRTFQYIDIESVPGFDASEAYPHAIVNRSRSKSSSG